MPVVPPRPFRVSLRAPAAIAHVDALLWPARGPADRAVASGIVLAHGAGTDQHHPLVAGLAQRLAATGVPVVTFNFAYRQAGRRAPDRPDCLDRVFLDVVAAASARIDGALVLAGRSMGARAAGRVAARRDDIAALIWFAYPLHRPAPLEHDPPAPLRTDFWPRLRVPVLFVQGERDRLCHLDVLERERARALAHVPSAVQVLAGADHSFSVRRRDGRGPEAVLDEAAAAAATWLRERVRGEGAQ